MTQNLRSLFFLFLCTALSLIGTAQDEITNTAGTSTTVAGVGTQPWVTPSATIWQNVREPDDDPGVPFAVVSPGAGQSSHFLVLSNFNFNIPLNYQIFQIIVNIYGNSTGTNAIIVQSLQLMNTSGGTYTPIAGSFTRNGFVGFETDPKKSTQVYGTLCNQACYWNTNLTPAHLNNPTFGLVVQFKNQSGAATTANIDYISITLVLGQQIPLPVKLSGFNGSYKNQKAMLSWATESEVDFEQFEVQRSSNGRNFTTIASVLPNGGNGMKAQYAYSDNLANESSAVFYYRLRLKNKDGMGAYSQTILIRKDAKAVGAMTIYPNPIRNGLASIKLNAIRTGNIELRVIDPSGRIVLRQRSSVFEGNNTMTLNNLNQLKSGTYVLQMINEMGEMEMTKFTTIR